MITTQDAQRLLGRNGLVTATDGAKIGKIGQIYLDDQSGNPEWVTVTTGLFGTSESFVPLAGATVAGDDIAVPYAKDKVKNAPRMEADGDLSPAEEDELYRYYGLTSQEGRLTTGTPAARTEKVDPAPAQDVAAVDQGDDAITRSEERLRVGTTTTESGRARLRKYIVTEQVSQTVPVSHEEIRIEREPITEANRGDALTGVELSEQELEVVLHADRVVVDKDVVAVERIKLGTTTVTQDETVTEQVRKEQIELGDGLVLRDRHRAGPQGANRARGGPGHRSTDPPEEALSRTRAGDRSKARSSRPGLRPVRPGPTVVLVTAGRGLHRPPSAWGLAPARTGATFDVLSSADLGAHLAARTSGCRRGCGRRLNQDERTRADPHGHSAGTRPRTGPPHGNPSRRTRDLDPARPRPRAGAAPGSRATSGPTGRPRMTSRVLTTSTQQPHAAQPVPPAGRAGAAAEEAGSVDRHLNQLVGAIARRDQDALRAFHDATCGPLAHRLTPLVDSADRDDVLVAVYLEVWRGAAAGRPTGPGVMGWLVQLALVGYFRDRQHNRSSNACRTQRPTPAP